MGQEFILKSNLLISKASKSIPNSESLVQSKSDRNFYQSSSRSIQTVHYSYNIPFRCLIDNTDLKDGQDLKRQTDRFLFHS